MTARKMVRIWRAKNPVPFEVPLNSGLRWAKSRPRLRMFDQERVFLLPIETPGMSLVGDARVVLGRRRLVVGMR